MKNLTAKEQILIGSFLCCYHNKASTDSFERDIIHLLAKNRITIKQRVISTSTNKPDYVLQIIHSCFSEEEINELEKEFTASGLGVELLKKYAE